MLIVDDGERWTAITQPAHAWLAGQLAQHWGTGEIAPPEPRAEVLLGVEQHDVAWVGYDRRPSLHEPAGRAASFIEAPFLERQLIWHEAPQRMLAQSAWAALLVSLHGTNIHTRYVSREHLPADQAVVIDDYLAAQRSVQDELLTSLGVARATAERQADLLFALDALSLSLCHGWPERDLPEVDGVAIAFRPVGEREGTLDPWPFARPVVEASLGARTLHERFTDETALHAALDEAPVERRTYLLRAS